MLNEADENRVQQFIDLLKSTAVIDKDKGLTISRQYWMACKLKELNTEIKHLHRKIEVAEEMLNTSIEMRSDLEDELDDLQLKIDQLEGRA